MKYWIGATSLLAAIVLIFASVSPSAAHRFNVTLVMPLTGVEADMGRQFQKGFMLATTERDAHANEESDGHLGGLDVYVSVVDANGDVGGKIDELVSSGEIDIVAAFGSGQTLALIENRLAGRTMVYLPPGRSPFAKSGSAPVVAFSSAFVSQYGGKPSADAAQGYNAARRIDVAVREQGGVAQTEALKRSFVSTASEFSW